MVKEMQYFPDDAKPTTQDKVDLDAFDDTMK
eukprot:CAMPEP_0185577934 /NCGR_PEP_ID=MMETSP0434-20130131/11514_1 /TAXON_ID=626734 ORGANISM="Favella taraikaensis, Strain Fe Narragansett Bay" /NCGR_SAMPLE_ID=MMETSP0434 /ASSEMBLY_ACC=CAM_ASM_000379 /LENGTH=30 /DNA_ID= /DNA_START= /DNA_END= /DNA_ORIENTATION=